MLEKEFEQFYSTVGRAAKPIRLMVGLILLKQIENLSDERVVEAWVQNPYYQTFCGMEHFSWSLPCDPSDNNVSTTQRYAHLQENPARKAAEEAAAIIAKAMQTSPPRGNVIPFESTAY